MDLNLFFEESASMMKMLVSGQVIVSSRSSQYNFCGMTVAWGFFGNLWNNLYFIAAVRPSRYTFLGIKHTGSFTVNFLDKKYQEELKYFGTVSGHTEDKFSMGALHIDSRLTDSFTAPIEEAILLLNCEVMASDQINPFTCKLLPDITKFYPNHCDYHIMIYGKILNLIKHE